jgi:hypothetical protein
MGGVIAVLFLAAIGVAIYAMVALGKGEILRFETLASPDEVLMASVGQVGTSRGWATVTQSPTNVALNYVRQPNILILLLLLVFCFTIPLAVVYYVLMSKKESLNVLMGDSTTGNTRVQITSNGWKGKRAGQALRDVIGVAPGAIVTETVNEAPAVPEIPGAPAIGGAGMNELPMASPTDVLGQVAPAPEPAAVSATPAGWYPDPDDASQQRYWDGGSWTEHRSPNP